jgi:hypothetical protein
MSEPTYLAKLRQSNRLLDISLYFINPVNWLNGFYHASVKNTANVSALSYIEKKADHLTDNLNLPGRILRTFFHLDLISHISPYIMWTSFASGLFDQAFNYDLKDWKSKYPMTLFFAVLLILFTITLALPVSPIIAAIITIGVVGIYSLKTMIEAENLKFELDEAKEDLNKVKDKYVEDTCETTQELIELIENSLSCKLFDINEKEQASLHEAKESIVNYKNQIKELKEKIHSSFTIRNVQNYLKAQRELIEQLKFHNKILESIATKNKISKLNFLFFENPYRPQDIKLQRKNIIEEMIIEHNKLMHHNTSEADKKNATAMINKHIETLATPTFTQRSSDEVKNELKNYFFAKDSILNNIPIDKSIVKLSQQIDTYENKLKELEKAADKLATLENTTEKLSDTEKINKQVKSNLIVYKGYLKNLLINETATRDKIDTIQSAYSEKLKFGAFRTLSMSGAIVGLLGLITLNPILVTIGGGLFVGASTWIVGGIFIPRIVNNMSESFEQQRVVNIRTIENQDSSSIMNNAIDTKQKNFNYKSIMESSNENESGNIKLRKNIYDKFIKKLSNNKSLLDKIKQLNLMASANNETPIEFEKKLNAEYRNYIFHEFSLRARVYPNSDQNSLYSLNSLLYKAEEIKTKATENHEQPEKFAEKLDKEWDIYYKSILKTESTLSYLQNKFFSPVDQSTDRVFEERQSFIRKYKIA